MYAKIAETGNKACLIWSSNISKVSSVTYPDFLHETKIRYFAFVKKILQKNYLAEFYFRLKTALLYINQVLLHSFFLYHVLD